MAAEALLFEPPRGVLVVPPTAAADLEGWISGIAHLLPDDILGSERTRVLAPVAQDAADVGDDATVVLVWTEDAEPFTLWIQLTPISGIHLARAFVRDSALAWIGDLRAPNIGAGLEWFTPASEDADPGWAAAFADEALFVHVTLAARSSDQVVARRSAVQTSVLPSLVIAAGPRPWQSDPAIADGVVLPRERWPQLAGAGGSA